MKSEEGTIIKYSSYAKITFINSEIQKFKQFGIKNSLLFRNLLLYSFLALFISRHFVK